MQNTVTGGGLACQTNSLVKSRGCIAHAEAIKLVKLLSIAT